MVVRKNTLREAVGRNTMGSLGAISVFLLVAAGSGFFVASRFPAQVSEQPGPPTVVAEFDTVFLPVPAEPVPAGQRVRDIRFKQIAFPRHQVPPGALESIESILDLVSTAALPASLPLFPGNFGKNSASSNAVLERIPLGMRAMTVKVDATAAVEGWAGSGSIVDVLLVERERTSVIAEKVTVLSAERSTSPVEGASAPNVPSTVTLLVTQEQCLAINTAIPLGRIAFALRSGQDGATWSEQVFTAERLKGRLASSGPQTAITGYIAINGETGRQIFALSDGKWIRTTAVPPGFHLEKTDQEGAYANRSFP